MKNARSELAQLLVGLGMLACGLVLFFSKVKLYIVPVFGGIFGDNMPIGILFVPFILGLVCMVLFSKQVWPKFLTGLSVLVMIVALVTSLRASYGQSMLFTIICIVLIFVGAALCIKVLVIDDPNKGSGPGRL